MRVGKIRVLVADDHTIVRQGLVSLLTENGDCEVVAEAADGVEAVAQAAEHRPEVVILDLSMPRLSGLEAVRRIRIDSGRHFDPDIVEAFLRWPHKIRGLVPTSEFLPIAELSGLSVQLGRWVLHTACHEVAPWLP